MKKLLCGALALACLAGPALAGGVTKWFTNPANTVAACQIAATLEQTVLADEQLANQIANKQVVRTGTTATIANVTPTLCAQLGGLATTIAQSALANAPTVIAPAIVVAPVVNPGATAPGPGVQQ